ncbi:uncharacterized protein LOC108682789 [Hyalella azteca]|uniref:Uncharacterized protein LOC108682789 n=1 Tax=Hyalella azteca TaxID=294128 RepID=A0A8B7PMV2_HYAAZ|nr:uncharacterized protein LOC108682789 [Hyalella azteca]
MRTWIFLLALSFAIAAGLPSDQPGISRSRTPRLRPVVHRLYVRKKATPQRRDEGRITERQLQYCGPNEVVGAHGRCERAHITKNVYAFTAPKYRRQVLPAKAPEPKLDLNVVFVKTHPNDVHPKPLVVPAIEQKTVVYVLSKRPTINQQLIQVPEQGPTEPEVFFVNYGSGENPILPGGIDLQTALSQTPSLGHSLSSDAIVLPQQGNFLSQYSQDYSSEDYSQRNSFSKSTVRRGIPSTLYETQPTDQYQSIVSVQQQSPFSTQNQFVTRGVNAFEERNQSTLYFDHHTVPHKTDTLFKASVKQSYENHYGVPWNDFHSRNASHIGTFPKLQNISLPSTPNQYETPSNNLLQDSSTVVQPLQPVELKQQNSLSIEKAKRQGSVASLPYAFKPAYQEVPPRNVSQTRGSFKPSSSLSSGQSPSSVAEDFVPVQGRGQYAPVTSNIQFNGNDGTATLGNQENLPPLIQKLEPAQWDFVPPVKSKIK